MRILSRGNYGSVAHFELAPGQVSVAVAHRTIKEIWYFVSGRGEMWRKLGEQEDAVPVDPGVSIYLPVDTHFQFRSYGYTPLATIGVTMLPWPGTDIPCVRQMGSHRAAKANLSVCYWIANFLPVTVA